MEKAVSRSIQKHDAVLPDAVSKIGGISPSQTGVLPEEQMEAQLPEVSGVVPEGVLDFRNQ